MGARLKRKNTGKKRGGGSSASGASEKPREKWAVSMHPCERNGENARRGVLDAGGKRGCRREGGSQTAGGKEGGEEAIEKRDA